MLEKKRTPSNGNSKTSTVSLNCQVHNIKSNDKITLSDRVPFVHYAIRGGTYGRNILY